MKKIYGVIIAVLSVLCLFLALYSFGLFDFRFFSHGEGYRANEPKRLKAVRQSPAWNIAVLGDEADQSYIAEVAQGIGRAALLINMDGGVLGKPLRIGYREPRDESYAARLDALRFCARPDIAFLIGPVSTARMRETRSLCQYYALPALAPFSPRPPELPTLEPDIFGVLYPARLLFDPLIARLKQAGCRNLLFVSASTDSYSRDFTNLLTERIRRDSFFTEIHRIDYPTPATESAFEQPLRRLTENARIDAIVFTDDPVALAAFGRAMRTLKLRLPVFGNDQLDVPTLRHYLHDCDFPLSYASFEGQILPYSFSERYKKVFRRDPGIKEQFGILCCLLFRDVLNDLGQYDVREFGRMMKTASENFFADESRRISLIIRDVKQTGTAVNVPVTEPAEAEAPALEDAPAQDAAEPAAETPAAPVEPEEADAHEG